MIFSSDSKKPEDFIPDQKLKDAYPTGMQFACTSGGSACQRTLDVELEEIVRSFGPDGVKYQPRWRIVVKLDGGPALDTLDDVWLENWRRRGVILFPGLPNASAVNQASFFCPRSVRMRREFVRLLSSSS